MGDSLLLYSVQAVGSPSVPSASKSSLAPVKWGNEDKRVRKGVPVAPGTPYLGDYMILHWAVPQQSLMSAKPVLATMGLLGGGSAFLSGREPAERMRGGERESRVRSQDHLYPQSSTHLASPTNSPLG